MDPLDNAVWHALRGPHRTLAEGDGAACRYPSSMAPFAAVADEPDDTGWRALDDLVGPDGVAVLFRAPMAAPGGWEVLTCIGGRQMSGEAVAGEPCDEATVLGDADVPAMRELVRRTEPGPFARRTIELGRYVGVRRGGRLVAMAGERLRLAGATEISAVCVDADHRGTGLGEALVRDAVHHIRERGDVPFLHVVHDNAPAIALYERLGFRRRRDIDALVLRPDGAPGDRAP